MIFSKQILNANGLVDSIQICVADLDKRFLFNKEICQIRYDEFFKKYEDNKKKANTFFNNIQTMMKMNLFTKELYESYFNQSELTEIFFIKFLVLLFFFTILLLNKTSLFLRECILFFF